MRSLAQHAGHSHGNRPGADDDTLDIRIAAVFVVLAAGLIGGLPPLFLKIFKDMSNPIARWLRAASAGIVISLAVVHIFPHGLEEFTILAIHVQLDPFYNCAGPALIFGILMMMVIEGVVHAYGGEEGSKSSKEPVKDDSSEEDSPKTSKVAAAAELPCEDIESHCHHHEHLHDHDHKHGQACLHGHGHVSGIGDYGTFKQKTLAHMFELGCVVHSVIIGIMLGVINKDFPQARNVFIALVFHQWLEGIGLGALVSIADFKLWKGIFLILFYSLTAPVGIAIGIGIATSYDPESTARNATQGTLNCVSAGILLYMGLVQMVAVDFASESLALLRHWWAKVGMYVAFFVAAGCMSFLAIWT